MNTPLRIICGTCQEERIAFQGVIGVCSSKQCRDRYEIDIAYENASYEQAALAVESRVDPFHPRDDGINDALSRAARNIRNLKRKI